MKFVHFFREGDLYEWSCTNGSLCTRYPLREAGSTLDISIIRKITKTLILTTNRRGKNERTLQKLNNQELERFNLLVSTQSIIVIVVVHAYCIFRRTRGIFL